MTDEGKRLRRSIYATLSFVAVIWAVKIIEFIFDVNFGEFGILPRTLRGSIGIFTAPFIHGDIYHLLSNSLPIIILGIGVFYFYDRIAIAVVLIIYLMTGFWVWVAAREAYHIGASGLVYGMLTFLLFSGFIRRDSGTLAISFVVLFLYGGTFLAGIVPEDGGISWESHLMGAVAGIFCAIYYKNYKIAGTEKNEFNEEDTQITQFKYHYKPSADDNNDEQNDHQDYVIRYPLKKDKE